MKKIWKKTEGFTLVEMVVVIAILGILAGVGTVSYSGYVKKANEAADEQLLHDLNNAFSAACVANGVDMSKLNERTAQIQLDNGEVKKENVVIDVGDKSEPTKDDFERFYASHGNSAFKNISHLRYEKIQFVRGLAHQLPNGGNLVMTDSQRKVVNDSAYGQDGDKLKALLETAQKMGAIASGAGASDAKPQVLANAVNALGGQATPGDTNLQEQLSTAVEAYQQEQIRQAVAEKLEMSIEDVTDTFIDEYEAENITEYNEIISNLGMDKIKENALAIGAAQGAADAKDEILDAKNEVLDAIEAIRPDVTGNQEITGSALVGAIEGAEMSEENTEILYDMLLGYLGAEPGDDVDVETVIRDLSPEEVNELLGYLDSEQVENDMDAYVELMETMTGSSVDQSTIDYILMNGLDDPKIVSGLLGLLGM